MLRDVRHAVRLWTRNPGFAAVAILTIGIGVGATTSLMAQMQAVFWTALPVTAPEQLRLLAWTAPRYPYVWLPNVIRGPRVDDADTFASFSYAAYTAMRDGSRSFADLACWADLGEARPVVLGEHGFGALQFVSGNYFRTLGVPAQLGRTIEPNDDLPDAAARVAMISDAFWARVFGRDPDVTRRTLRLNGQTFAIVGVMPRGFFGMDPAVSPDVMVPIGATQIAAATVNPIRNARIWTLCRVVGRLAPGVTEAQASLDVEQWVAQAIAAEPPPEPYDAPRVVLLAGGHGLSTLRDAASTPLIVLLTVVAVLLIATCANIAGLLLARGSSREKELATRIALGAPRSRVIRQLVTESLVLSLAGGVAGVAIAYALAGFAPALLTQFLPTLFGADRALTMSADPDARVLLCSLLVTLSTGLLFGILPAWRAARVDLISTIKSTAASGMRLTRPTAGQAMVLVETALAVVLLIGAGLFFRTIANLRGVEMGFQPEGILYARVEPRSGGLPPAQRGPFFESAVKRLEALPGVVSASAAADAPLGGAVQVGMAAVGVVCVPDGKGGYQRGSASVNGVLPGYFGALGVPLHAGRDFTWTDNSPGVPTTTIVNESFVRRYLPGISPVDQVIRSGLDCDKQFVEIRIVGVVADTSGLRTAAEPAMYWSLRGFAGPVTLVLRTRTDPAAMVSTVRRAMTELNADIPTFSEATLVDLRERQLRRERLLSDLLALFGAATVIVCCLGIYGMLSYSVARRRAELSIRLAIGAQPRAIVRMVIRESLLPVAAGIALGCAVALMAARWVESLLFGVSARDPLTFAASAIAFLIVAAMAALLPARTASRVDPVLALRGQ